MPVSLGRRLRRIGIPPKEQRAADWKPDTSSSIYLGEAKDHIKKAKKKRRAFFENMPRPQSTHRRSKSRIKVTKREVPNGKK